MVLGNWTPSRPLVTIREGEREREGGTWRGGRGVGGGGGRVKEELKSDLGHSLKDKDSAYIVMIQFPPRAFHSSLSLA